MKRPVRLVEKYRPRKVEDFVGHSKIKAQLSNFTKQPYPAAFLFIGPPGTGKTTMGQAMGEQIGAEIHLLGSRQANFDAVERLCFDCEHIPNGLLDGKWTENPFHLIVMDEVDQVTETAQYLLLSKLDSTQTVPNTIWVFTCNSIKKLEGRFIDRCIQMDFSTYGMSGELVEFLRKVWQAEGGAGDEPDFERVVRDNGNNVRSCLMRLEAELLARR